MMLICHHANHEVSVYDNPDGNPCRYCLDCGVRFLQVLKQKDMGCCNGLMVSSNYKQTWIRKGGSKRIWTCMDCQATYLEYTY